MAKHLHPELAAAEAAFSSHEFAEAAARYRRAFDEGAGGISDRLRYGIASLFAGNRAEFDRIGREAAEIPESSASPALLALLKRYAALSLALGSCALLSACDRVTYPYEAPAASSAYSSVTPVVHKYGGPPVVISLYSVSPVVPIYPDPPGGGGGGGGEGGGTGEGGN